MEKLDKKVIYWSIALSIIVLIIGITIYIEKDYQPIKIDLFVNDYVSNLINQNGNICTKENLNLEFNNTKIFAPQSFIINDRCILPSTPLGYILLINLTKIIHPDLFKYLNILFFLLLINIIYLIVKNNYSEKTAIWSSILCAIFAPLLFFTSLTFNNILAIFFYFTFTYFFLEGIKKDNKKYFIICGILAGFHMWIRFYDVVYYLPFLVFIRKENIKNIFFIFLIFFPFLGLILIFSQYFFSSPIGILGIINENSIQTLKEPYVGILGYEPSFFIDFNYFLKNLIKYGVLFFPLLFITFITNLFYPKNKNYDQRLYYFFLILILITFIFFSLGAYQGFEYNSAILDSSYNRYFLPAFISLIIMLSWTLQEFINRQNKKLVLIIVSIFVILNILILVTSFSGINDLKLKQESYKDKTSYFSLLDQNSIVFTKYSDIYFYPNAHVAYYGKFQKETRLNDTVNLIQEILKTKKYRVYFTNDDYWNQDPIENYLKLLESKNYSINQINNYLYEIKENDRIQVNNKISIGIYSGNKTIMQKESEIGIKLDHVLLFQKIENLNYTQVKKYLDNNYSVILNIEFYSDNFTLNKISEGFYDQKIKSFLSLIPNNEKRLSIRTLHEFNGHWYPWGIFYKNNTLSDFKSSWKHIYNLCKEKNSNINLQLNYNRYNGVRKEDENKWGEDPMAFKEMFPGEEYVDKVVITNYNRVGTDKYHIKWEEFNDSLNNAYNQIILFTNKSIGIAETSSMNSQLGKKSDWIMNAFYAIKYQFNRVDEITFFLYNRPIENNTWNWDLNNQEELNSFKIGANIIRKN